MLLSTGSHGIGVGRSVPVMIRIDVFSCTSTSLVWNDLGPDWGTVLGCRVTQREC